MIRRLILNWQITRDISRNITPARKARQEAARKGKSTEWKRRGEQARAVFGEMAR